MMSNILCLFGLVCVFQYLARNTKDPARLPMFAGWAEMPMFFGLAIFSFEGIGVVRTYVSPLCTVTFLKFGTSVLDLQKGDCL